MDSFPGGYFNAHRDIPLNLSTDQKFIADWIGHFYTQQQPEHALLDPLTFGVIH